MFERLSASGKAVMVRAQQEAMGAGHDWLGTEHLLLAVLGDADGIPTTALRGLGITGEQIRADFMVDAGRCERPAAGPLDPGALAAIGQSTVGVYSKPQVAILSTDGIKRRPVAVEGPGGDVGIAELVETLQVRVGRSRQEPRLRDDRHQHLVRPRHHVRDDQELEAGLDR